MKNRITVLVMLLIAATSHLRAQDWYVSVGTGVTESMAENMSVKEIFHTWPSGHFAIGDFFSPYFGMRLSGAFRPQVGRAGAPQRTVYPDTYDRYRFNTATADLHLAFNLSSYFEDNDPLRSYDLIFLIGGGALRSLHYESGLEEWDTYYPINTELGTFATASAGLQALVRINRHWKWAAEMKVYALKDKYNGVDRNRWLDTFLDMQVGMVYFFDGKKRTIIHPVEVRHDLLPVYKPNQVVGSDGTTVQPVQFYVESTSLIPSQTQLVEDLALYLQMNPQYRIQVCGYPDNEALASDYNTRLASQRAQTVATLLRSKGIAPNRIEMVFANRPVMPFHDVSGEWITGVSFVLK